MTRIALLSLALPALIARCLGLMSGDHAERSAGTTPAPDLPLRAPGPVSRRAVGAPSDAVCALVAPTCYCRPRCGIGWRESDGRYVVHDEGGAIWRTAFAPRVDPEERPPEIAFRLEGFACSAVCNPEPALRPAGCAFVGDLCQTAREVIRPATP